MRNLINEQKTNKFNWEPSILPITGDYFRIIEIFAHLPFTVLKIEQVENDPVYLDYFAQKFCVSLKNSQEFVEEIAFFGSSEIDPIEMCSSKLGFDFRKFPLDTLPFGRGFHLYEDALYIHEHEKTSYADPNNPDIYKIILAKVIVGEFEPPIFCSDETKKLKFPTQNPAKKIGLLNRYDSVCGYTENKRKIFITYDNYTVLPLFIITYDISQRKSHANVHWFHEDHAFDKETSDEIEFNYLSGKKEFSLNSLEFNFNEMIVVTVNDNIRQGLIRKLWKENFKQICFLASIDFDFICIDQKFMKSYVTLNEEMTSEILSSMIELLLLKHKPRLNLIEPVEQDSKEFNQQNIYFLQNFKNGDSHKKIVAIEKINNHFILTKFLIQKILMALKSNCATEKRLFHGTRQNEPKNIFEDIVGFDMRYSIKGMWGKANYFAVNSSYSNDYSYTVPNDSNRQMFIARVLIGDSINMPNDPNLVEPPFKDGLNIQYDSVNGETNGSIVYMSYENSRALPEYLITYT